jgi:class 3 adenylate cyclase
MRIGLNSGPVVVGAIGDDLRMDYTAAGDTTNIAARLQSLAKPGTVLVSENAYRLTKDFFEFDSLGPVDMKGSSSQGYSLAHRGIRRARVHTSGCPTGGA